MGAKKKRRIRSPHPGVVLVAPRGAYVSWVARWVDPDSGKTISRKVDPRYTTHEARRDWAVDKSKELVARQRALEAGAPRATGTTLTHAVERYYKGHPHLAPRYLSDLKKATTKFTTWAARVGVESGDDLTLARLLSYREQLIAEPRKRQAAKGKRGAREESDKLRAPSAVNGDLRRLSVVLGYLRRAGLLPKLSSDDIKDGLKKLIAPVERLDFVPAKEVQALLKAALVHDAMTFTETREEHVGEGRRRIGKTPRYDPIAPFVAFVVLSGMRLNEVLSLTWDRVDLDARDHRGVATGEIHLLGRKVKTGKARTVGLDVSPTLKPLLAAMGEGKQPTDLVFAGYTEALVNAAAKRLRADFRAPDFDWQSLRRTTGTYLTNSPGIYSGSSAYQSAKRLGHSVEVAERHYAGVVRGIDPKNRTLEAVLGIGAEMKKVIAGAG